MIKPTVGRVVWFHPDTRIADSGFTYHGGGAPLAAIIAHVWNDELVNLAVFDSNGVAHNRTSVALIQEGGSAAKQDYHSYAEWMPYQKGQAAKTEAAETELLRATRKEPTIGVLAQSDPAGGPLSSGE